MRNSKLMMHINWKICILHILHQHICILDGYCFALKREKFLHIIGDFCSLPVCANWTCSWCLVPISWLLGFSGNMCLSSSTFFIYLYTNIYFLLSSRESKPSCAKPVLYPVYFSFNIILLFFGELIKPIIRFCLGRIIQWVNNFYD